MSKHNSSIDQWTRRSWLGAVPGAIGLAGIAGRQLTAQEYDFRGASIKLGVASYSFRKYTREQAIEMTKKLGTPYLNIKDVHLKLDSTPDEIAAARREFTDDGIILVGCGNVSFQNDDEADIRSKFEYAKQAGFPLIVCAPTAVTLPKLEKFVKEYDIKIAVHNHGPEDHNFPTPQSVLKIVNDLDPRCGLCIDVGHTARTGVDVVGSVAEAGPRLLDMHIKDLRDLSKKDSQCDVGDGKMPIRQIFLQLVKMNYRASVNLEYEINEDNVMPGMQRSFADMHKVLDEIKNAKGTA